MTVKPLSPYCFCSSTKCGISTRHGTHYHVAQKSTIRTWPRKSENFTGLPFKSASSHSGTAGLGGEASSATVDAVSRQMSPMAMKPVRQPARMRQTQSVFIVTIWMMPPPGLLFLRNSVGQIDRARRRFSRASSLSVCRCRASAPLAMFMAGQAKRMSYNSFGAAELPWWQAAFLARIGSTGRTQAKKGIKITQVIKSKARAQHRPGSEEKNVRAFERMEILAESRKC
jgi:hypothetical protein